MLRRVRFKGRLIGMVTEPGQTLVHYGDLTDILPASFGDPLPVHKRQWRHRQVFIATTDLAPFTRTDTVAKQTRAALKEVLAWITNEERRRSA